MAAAILLEQGHEVIAGFMKNYADESNPNCHTREDRDIAMKVAQHLGIKTFVIFDFRKEYEEHIIRYIYEGYQQGITPNPDVLCNTMVKFDLFLEAGLHLGCDAVATGHYARIISHVKSPPEGGKGQKKVVGHPSEKYFSLLKGIDSNKDQSYFLS